MSKKSVRKTDQTLRASTVIPTDPPIPPLAPEQRVVDFGVSGLNRFGGYVYEEFLPELQGPRGQKVLREMRDNDPTIGAMLFVLEHMIKQVDWTITPHGDAPAAGDDEAAAFLQSCLFDDMGKTWMDTLSEICSMFWAGFAPLEIVYKPRKGEQPGTLPLSDGQTLPLPPSNFSDGRLGWAKWGVRAQETVLRWQFDAGSEWQALVQTAPPDYTLRIIPREKLLLFRVKADRENPEGRSLIRNCYSSWFKKKKLEVIEGIGLERKLAGLPVLIPPSGLDLWNTKDPNAAAQLTRAKNIVKNLRMDEQMGVVLPFGWELKLLSADGGKSAVDTNTVIDRYDHRMAMCIAMDFLFLGSGGKGGARAQAGVDVTLFNTALEGLLDGICDTVNRDATPKLFRYNGQPVNRLPKLAHGDVQTPDLGALGAFITSLAGAGMQLFPDPELEHSLRAAGGLPEPVGGVGKRAVKKLRELKRRLKNHTTHLEPPATGDRAVFLGAVEHLRKVVESIAKEG